VATAPTPARAQGTTARTLGNFDCTATPRSPLAGSTATIEKVATSGRAELLRGALPAAAKASAAAAASAQGAKRKARRGRRGTDMGSSIR